MKDFLIESVALCPRKVEAKEERENYSSSFVRQNYTKLHEGKDFFSNRSELIHVGVTL